MKAIIAGTFDPFTAGHRNLVERALAVFGGAVVAVASDTGLRAAPLAVRVKIAELSVADLDGVTVVPFDGLLSEFLTAQGECVLVRGVRNTKDFEYERELAAVYRSLCGKDCVLLATAPELAHVSSTVVRELAALGVTDKLEGYVAPAALDGVSAQYGNKNNG